MTPMQLAFGLNLDNGLPLPCWYVAPWWFTIVKHDVIGESIVDGDPPTRVPCET